MIKAKMREYEFYTLGTVNAYGQPQISEQPQGTVKMAIFSTAQSIQNNALYKDCTYLGLTSDTAINDKYIIQYGAERLKVLYINAQGRLKQVFMSEAV